MSNSSIKTINISAALNKRPQHDPSTIIYLARKGPASVPKLLCIQSHREPLDCYKHTRSLHPSKFITQSNTSVRRAVRWPSKTNQIFCRATRYLSEESMKVRAACAQRSGRRSCNEIISQRPIIHVISRGHVHSYRQSAVTYTCQRNGEPDYSRKYQSEIRESHLLLVQDTPGALFMFVHPWHTRVSPLTHSSAKKSLELHRSGC